MGCSQVDIACDFGISEVRVSQVFQIFNIKGEAFLMSKHMAIMVSQPGAFR